MLRQTNSSPFSLCILRSVTLSNLSKRPSRRSLGELSPQNTAMRQTESLTRSSSRIDLPRLTATSVARTVNLLCSSAPISSFALPGNSFVASTAAERPADCFNHGKCMYVRVDIEEFFERACEIRYAHSCLDCSSLAGIIYLVSSIIPLYLLFLRTRSTPLIFPVTLTNSSPTRAHSHPSPPSDVHSHPH
jgi:hypothetical protein